VFDQIASMVEGEHRYRGLQGRENQQVGMDQRPAESGAPCPIVGPGLLNNYAGVLRASRGDVHFLRTETAFEWK
jgi:monoamine oxidase